MILIDAHQDLAYNVLNFGRDYLRSAAETRRFEQETGSQTPDHNGNTLLGWPDFQKARSAVIFSTLFAAPERRKLGDWDRVVYRDAAEAHRLYQAQVDVYHRWVEDHPDKFRLIRSRKDLEAVLSPWLESNEASNHPVGLVILMEGAEGVRAVEELELWWARGVRIIGPAWAGTRFCGGTGEPGPLTKEGYELLEGMASTGFTLDISHMDERAVLEALDFYQGPVIATHANALGLLQGSESNRFLSNRHLSDLVIQRLIEREGVIGVVPLNAFLKSGWKRGDPRSAVPLDLLAAQIDYICQMAGTARHVGIGSDFDGGFGVESTPEGIDTIQDLYRLSPLLIERGYSETDIAAIFNGNWRSLLSRALPEE